MAVATPIIISAPPNGHRNNAALFIVAIMPQTFVPDRPFQLSLSHVSEPPRRVEEQSETAADFNFPAVCMSQACVSPAAPKLGASCVCATGDHPRSL